MTSSSNISIIGDGPLTTTFRITHSGVGLSLVQTYTFSCITIKGLHFQAYDSTAFTAVALSITLPIYASGPYISLILEDIRLWGVGSSVNNLTPSPSQQAFVTGMKLQGGINARINRLSFSGPAITTQQLVPVGTAVELTTAVEVHIDSCYFQQAKYAVAILDGGCQGIYLRSGTFIGMTYLLASIGFTTYNSVVSGTLSSSASGTIVTLQSLGSNPLDAVEPWIGANMTVVSGSGYSLPSQPVVLSVDRSSNTVTLSKTVTLSNGAVLGFQYGQAAWGGIVLSVLDSEIAATASFIQLGSWTGVRIIGNNFEPLYGAGPAFDFSDVAGCIITNNNLVGNSPASCFSLSFSQRDANAFVISGNLIYGFSKLLSIGNNVFDVQFHGNGTGSVGSAQFSDSNVAQPANLVLYTAASTGITSALTSVHPLAINGTIV